MRKLVLLLFAGCVICLLNSCAAVKCCFYCEDRTLTICIDDQDYGTEFAHFQAPHGTQEVTVTLKKDGLPVYSNTYYVNSYHNNELITVQYSEEYKYSETRKFHN